VPVIVPAVAAEASIEPARRKATRRDAEDEFQFMIRQYPR